MKMANVEKLKELFEEQSLRDLLKVFEDTFPKPMRARYLGLLSAFVALLCLGSAWQKGVIADVEMHNTAASLAGYALTISSALTGVVIAGMSIFAASLKPNVAARLISTLYPGTQISSLKFMFSMFAYLLFSLFMLILICGVYYAFLGREAVGGQIIQLVVSKAGSSDLYTCILMLYVSILVGFTVFLLSILRSFIWNLHQVLMVVIAAEQLPDKN